MQPLLPHTRASERSEQAFYSNQPFFFFLAGDPLLNMSMHPMLPWQQTGLIGRSRGAFGISNQVAGFLSVWQYCCLTAGIQPHKEPLITVAISLRHVLMAVIAKGCANCGLEVCICVYLPIL